MNISKTQVAIIIFALILLVIIIFALGRPQPKVTVPKAETKTQEQALPEVGKYELPPAGESAPESSQWKPVMPASKEPLSAKTLEKAKTTPEPEYDSVSPEASVQEEHTKQGKHPSPQTLDEMQKRGVVAY